jgi:diaminohydroxyphosphoribosylaminopyrimidine deaminase / 5-amino-6-(5-phosphoribosylamino)uracil reductase
MNNSYTLYLRRAYDIAKFGNGSTSPNPSVGALLLNNRLVIGEGFHVCFGKAHAEVNCFLNVKNEFLHLIENSEMVCTLEPCCHLDKKTPPCVYLIIEKKIKKVIVSQLDPNPKVAGKGINILNNNKIEILVHEHTTNNDNLLKIGRKNTLIPFYTNVSLKRPYIILKWAESADKYIGKKNEKIQISNPYSTRLTHKWRSESDAIMVGTNTVLNDNPTLTTRYHYGKNPVRVVLDRKSKIPDDANIFDNNAKTIIYTEGPYPDNINGNIVFKNINFNDSTIEQILTDLYSQNIGILFVEGGAQLLNTFIEKDLWDEARVFRSPILLHNGIEAPQLKHFSEKTEHTIDDNLLVVYQNKNY